MLLPENQAAAKSAELLLKGKRNQVKGKEGPSAQVVTT